MNSLRIAHRLGSYEVLFESVEAAMDRLPADIRFITDQNVFDRHRGLLEGRGLTYIVEPGEPSKSMEVLTSLLSQLAKGKASRKTAVCALGGGVIGDLAGFTAAAYMRGVPFIQIPTSLLAQVDSSVGGKVGVDLPEGKNLAGAFYPPQSVSICPEFLHTLPDNQFRNGMGEVWKYGFIMDKDLVELLSKESLHKAHPALAGVVERCISLKAQVVQEDEYETLGLRAILNYGHTVGHAIEYTTGYGTVLHGEAVSIGMVVEARLGELLGISPAGVAETVSELLAKDGLPIDHECLKDEDTMVAAMYVDKKAVSGKLAFSLLTNIGECRLVESVDESIVRRALRGS